MATSCTRSTTRPCSARSDTVRPDRRCQHARSERVQGQAFLKSFFSKQKQTSKADSRSILLTDKRTIGDLEDVSPMGLGTWAWGNQLLWGYEESMDPELQEVFDFVVSRGVNLFDTADSYGTGKLNGRSEQLLGRFVQEAPRSGRQSQDIHIATKLAGYPWRVTPWNMRAACRGSLRRLDMEQVSIGQLHWSAAKYAPLQEWAMVNGIADCYEAGLMRNVGVSNYGPQQLRKVHAQLAKRGVPLASAQVQFSLLSWGPAQQELVEVCEELGVALIAYSPLGLGLLTGKYCSGDGALPEGPRGQLFKGMADDVQPVLQTLRRVAEETGRSESQVAINWCMCKGTIPIPGVKNMAMAEDNLGACGWRLTGEQEATLDAATREVSKGMVQNVFQTK